jgi:L-alanine-DL-glutamate epimerase-like enolase superfamily enzyme
MKITKVETILARVDVDRRADVVDAKGFRFESTIVIIRVHTDEGIIGIGEANGSADWSGETGSGTKALIDEHFAPKLVGEDPRRVNACMRRLERTFGNSFAKAGIEMALLDIVGRATGASLTVLLGGAVRPPSIPLRFPLFPTDAAQAAALARRVVAEGCRTVKAKVGRDPMEVDLERVAAVREAVGDDVRVTVDASGGWSVSEALRIAPRLADLGVDFIEQPVSRHDLDGLAYVRARSPLPIMADEAVFTMQDALACITKRAADVISVYPGKHGGIMATVSLVAMAEAAGIACAIGSNLEWDIASAAMGHLAVAIPSIDSERYAADIVGTNFHVQRAVRPEPTSDLGRYLVPDGPGLGVELDLDAIEQRRITR